MCYWTCPVYDVQIGANGEVNYNGEAYVEKMGHHEWFVHPDAINALNDAILKYGYFSIRAKDITME